MIHRDAQRLVGLTFSTHVCMATVVYACHFFQAVILCGKALKARLYYAERHQKEYGVH